MKKICILVCFLVFLLKIAAFTQKAGYLFLHNNGLKIQSVQPYKKETVQKFCTLLNDLHRLDQDVRYLSYEKFMMLGKKTDSLNFTRFKKFCDSYGYFSFNHILSDSAEKRLFPAQTFYTLKIHFSDNFGITLLKIIEQSILKGTCNENDLMEFFITYVWRNTEFKNNYVFDLPFHIVLLPDLENGKYSSYYRFALTKYTEYCVEHDKTFLYFLLSRVMIKNNKICWESYQLNLFLRQYASKQISDWVKLLRSGADILIKEANAFPIPDGEYSIFFSSHPNILTSPPYQLSGWY